MLNADFIFTMQGNDPITQRQKRTVLERARKYFGYPPNLIVEMSRNPATADGYLRLLSALQENGTLTPAEQQIVMLAISAWHGCEYSMAAHRTAAKRSGTSQNEIDRLSRLESPADRRNQALASATWALMDKSGWLATEDLAPFEELAIEKAQIYEIIALIALELIATYISHIEEIPLDAAIVSQRFGSRRDADE